MKKLYFLLLFFSNLTLSQIDSISIKEKAYLFVNKQCDSLFKVRKTLNDGKYTIFYDKEKQLIAKIFYLENGNVTNLYREYTFDGYLTIGYYQNDSLWTFFTSNKLQNKNDSFKRGLWSYMIGSQINLPTEQYKIDFNIDSLFYEKWLYKNDSLRNFRKYHQRLGLIYDAGYSIEGKLEFELIKYPNSTLYKEFDSIGNLVYMTLNEGFDVEINLKKKDYFKPFEANKSIRILNQNKEKEFVILSTLFFDKNYNLIECSCGDVKFNYCEKKQRNVSKRKISKKVKS